MLRHQLSILLMVLSVLACNNSGGSAKQLLGETVRAACAMCIFKMEGVRGCMWAVEIDGKYYLADGALPENHQDHAPDGMCNIPRQAVVDGALRGGKFVATRFDLLPPTNVPTQPRFTPADEH